METNSLVEASYSGVVSKLTATAPKTGDSDSGEMMTHRVRSSFKKSWIVTTRP